MSAVLEMRDVFIALGRGARRQQVLDGIDLSVEPGRTVGLIGASGSGKTTVGRIALGLLRPDDGTVAVSGRMRSGGTRGLAGKVQAVLQNPQWSFNPRRTVGQSVAEPLQVVDRGLRRAHRRISAARILSDVGLDDRVVDRYPHELSGGQRQRAAIARALITGPEFIVFDEAVSALDIVIQQKVIGLIRALQEEHGFAALFISHDLAATRSVADRIAVIHAGRIVEQGESRALLNAPTHPYTRRLVEDR